MAQKNGNQHMYKKKYTYIGSQFWAENSVTLPTATLARLSLIRSRHHGLAKILETKPRPEPLAKRIENVSLGSFSGHLKGGIHDPLSLGPKYE